MSDSSFTVGGFAESLINQELGKVQEDPSYIAEAVSSEMPSSNVPDLREVEVPDNFMSQILGEEIQEEPDSFTEPQILNEDTLVLIEQLHSLVKNLDSVLTALKENTSGMLGVGPGDPKKATSFIKNIRMRGGSKRAKRGRGN